MTIRRINFTKRKKLRREDVDIVLHEEENGPSWFSVALKTATYDFPPDAALHVEAYRRTRVMRFPLGTVASPVVSPRLEMTDFEKDEEVLFRVKVTQFDKHPGMLLAHADKIRPRRPNEAPESRFPILPPIPADLEEEVWRLEFDDKPLLYVNKRLPDWKETVKSNEFRALVYPTVVREVFSRMLLVDHDVPSMDGDTWQSQWLNFARAIPGVRDIPKEAEDHEDWITDTAASFARRFRMLQRYSSENIVPETTGG